ALVLDREVGNAAPRIDLIGRRKGVGRAAVEAGAARAAMVPLRAIRLKLSFGEDRTKEQPGTELPADEIGVLSLPTDPGSFRQRFFHDRGGVNENLHVLPGARSEFLRQLLELALDDVVVITVPGI